MNISEGAKIVGPPHSLDLLLCPSITGSWPSVGDVWNWFPTKCTDFQIVSIFIKLTVFIQHTHYTLTNSNNASILGTEVQRVACLQWIECQQIWNWYENHSCRLLKDQIYLLLNSLYLIIVEKGLRLTSLKIKDRSFIEDTTLYTDLGAHDSDPFVVDIDLPSKQGWPNH